MDEFAQSPVFIYTSSYLTMIAPEIVRNRYVCKYCDNVKWVTAEGNRCNSNNQQAFAAHVRYCPMKPFGNISSSNSSIRHDYIDLNSKKKTQKRTRRCWK